MAKTKYEFDFFNETGVEVTPEEFEKWRENFSTGWGGGYTLCKWTYDGKIICWGLRDSNDYMITDLYWESKTFPCGKYGFRRSYANSPIALKPLGVEKTPKGLMLVVKIYNKYETIKHIPLY